MKIIDSKDIPLVRLIRVERQNKGTRNSLQGAVLDLIKKVFLMEVGQALLFDNSEWHAKTSPAVLIPRYLKSHGFQIKLSILKTVEPEPGGGWMVIKKS